MGCKGHEFPVITVGGFRGVPGIRSKIICPLRKWHRHGETMFYFNRIPTFLPATSCIFEVKFGFIVLLTNIALMAYGMIKPISPELVVPPPPRCACTALSKDGVGVEPPF